MEYVKVKGMSFDNTALDKKQEQQKKFLEAMRKNKEVNQQRNASEIEKADNKNHKKLQKTIKQLESKLKQADNKYQKLHKDHIDLKTKHTLLKTQLHEAKEHDKKMQLHAQQLERQIDVLKETISSLQTQLNEYTKQNTESEFAKLKRQLIKVIRKNQKLTQQVTDLKRRNKRYSEQLKNSKLIAGHDQKKSMAALQNALDSTLKELQTYKQKCVSLETYKKKYELLDGKHDTHKLALMLLNKLNENSNWPHAVLQELFYKLSVVYTDPQNNKRTDFQYPFYVAHHAENDLHVDYKTGNLVYENEQWFFIDDSENKYVAVGFPGYMQSQHPVRAIIENGAAIIAEVIYPTNKNKMRVLDSTAAKKVKCVVKKVASASKKVSSEPTGISVLIVGSRNKNTYTNLLMTNGYEPIWHDPYEESFPQLMSKIQRADIVIICERHVPHPVMYCVRNGDPKITTITRDNKQTILARIKYMIQNLNLMAAT